VSLVPLKLDGATWGPNRASFPDPSAPYVPEYVEPSSGAPEQAPLAVAPLLEALFKAKAVEHSHDYADAFFEKLLRLLPVPDPRAAAAVAGTPASLGARGGGAFCDYARGAAIERVVEASKGRLNWTLDLPMPSWNHMKHVADGSVELQLGTYNCFTFEAEIMLADFVLVFGLALAVLDMNGQNKCTGKIYKPRTSYLPISRVLKINCENASVYVPQVTSVF